MHKPEKGSLLEMESYNALILDFPDSRTMSHKCHQVDGIVFAIVSKLTKTTSLSYIIISSLL